MRLEDLLARRLLIQGGKGGSGRTTLSAALGLVAARRGRRVLLVEVDTPDRFAALFGLAAPVGYELCPLAEGLWGLNLDPDQVVVDFFRTHVRVRAVYQQILRSRLWRTFYEAGPGLRELICLGKVWRLLGEREPDGRPRWDTIVLDAPATGHGLAILGIADVAAQTLFGPMRSHAEAIRDLLRDPAATVLNICALPEEMPVNEAAELYAAVRERLQIPLGVCFVNGVLPAPAPGFCEHLAARLEQDPSLGSAAAAVLGGPAALDALRACARWRCARASLQQALLQELAARVPLPQVRVPYLLDADFDRRSLEAVAAALERGFAEAMPAPRATAGAAAPEAAP
ncbi:MAG: hypothetical protein KatS3mg102_1717 [Planctomycetota bacterium]|nr:MAG: hypothetical protein KatS3mg102_1717 [Planctomycetota bacterium]